MLNITIIIVITIIICLKECNTQIHVIVNSYLSDREHFASWNQTHSPLLNLNIGVPKEKEVRGERTKSGAEIVTSQDGSRCEL